MSASNHIFRLTNGGTMAFNEYGNPEGAAVLFCHGWPSSRTMAELTDDAARKVGVRIISPDRPGIAGSSFEQNRTLLDWPDAVRQLMDSLAIDEFRVLAISGGAPYAYATAREMPERVPSIAVVSGAIPITELTERSGLMPLHRWMLTLYQRHPEILRTCFHLARPFACIRPPIRFRPLVLKLLQPCDADVLRDSAAFEACFESQRRAWRSSARGVIADAEIYARPWGFPLDEVRVPVRLWHGKKDRTFAFRLAEDLATRLPRCELKLVEGAGHYSLPIRHMREILDDLTTPSS